MAFGSALGQRPSVSKYSAITAEYPVATGYSVNLGDVVDVVGGELTKSITKQDVSTVKIAGGLTDVSIGGSYPQYNKIQNTHPSELLATHSFCISRIFPSLF